MRAVAALLPALAFIALALLHSEGPKQDPDRFYHLALSRMYAEEGVPQALPQVSGLSWDVNFTDKEFLFHVVTAAAYLVGGDGGVDAVPALIGAALLFLIVFVLARSTGAWPASVAVIVVALGSPHWLQRALLLRPHVLAVFLFVALMLALMARRRGAAFVLAACFALAHHAIYMPAIAALLAFGVGLRGDDALRRAALFCLAGIVVGTLANPYFPGTLVMMALHVGVATGAAEEGASRASELVPMAVDVFARTCALYLLVLCLAAWLWLRRPRDGAEGPTQNAMDLQTRSDRLGVGPASGAAGALGGLKRPPRESQGASHFAMHLEPEPSTMRVDLFLLLLCGVLWALTVKTPRALEYAAPATVVLAVCSFSSLSLRGQGAFLLCALLLQGQAVLAFLSSKTVPPTALYRVQALAQLLEPGARVMNCEWARSPPLLYQRPDVRFIDVLEPALLESHDEARARLRRDFNAGRQPDAKWVVHDVFQAQYALCQSPGAIASLDADVRFRRLSLPGEDQDPPFLYRYDEDTARALAAVQPCLQVTPLRVPAAGYQAVTPSSPALAPSVEVCGRSYVDARWLFGALATGEDACVALRPSRANAEHDATVAFLGLGGGRNVRAWRGEEPLFRSVEAFAEQRAIAALVPLDRPLTPADDIVVIACSAASSPYLGAALSLWSHDDVTRACAHRTASLGPDDARPWRFTRTQARSCLAPFAAPSAAQRDPP